MTHDELLAKIDHHMLDIVETGFNDYKAHNALRTVVELHKSKETTYQKMLGKWASDSSVLSCEYCGGYYPCQTILVVQKALQ